MVITFKDCAKLCGISIVACCAVFVCTLFLNYNIDLAGMEGEIASEAGLVMYRAQVSMGKVTVAVTGGCLAVTSAVMLLFYIKNYIDTHAKVLGVLKALGYSSFAVAKHFWVFGLSVLLGCAGGYLAASLYLPTFYALQNVDGLFPAIQVQFHPLLFLGLVGMPCIVFSGLSILFACLRLAHPVLALLSGTDGITRSHRAGRDAQTEENARRSASFLHLVSRTTRRSKKMLVFFVAFSAFCFSAMVQMAMSMHRIASASFAWMILSIGLILAFVTLILSLSSVVRGNAQTIAMMRAFGYEDRLCCHAVLGAYRYVSYIGFLIGTVYQWGLLKLVMTYVFSDVMNMPEYRFDIKALLLTLVIFVIVYELVMQLYALRVRRISVKEIMLMT